MNTSTDTKTGRATDAAKQMESPETLASLRMSNIHEKAKAFDLLLGALKEADVSLRLAHSENIAHGHTPAVITFIEKVVKKANKIKAEGRE